MKRSEVLKKLIPFVIGKTTIIQQAHQGIYESQAERLLEFIEKELKMLPPRTKLSHIDAYDNAWDPED